MKMPATDPRAYIRMANMLRTLILAGTYEPGHPVPSIGQMHQETGHARPTCAHALHVLVEEGLLTFIPGHGYIVGEITSKETVMALVVFGTDQNGLKELELHHEVKNKGSITEEQHFTIRRPDDSKVLHFILGPDAARELKAHIL